MTLRDRARWLAALLAVPVAFTALSSLAIGGDEFAAERTAMVAEVEADVRLSGSLSGRATLAPAVIRALQQVPRHLFVPEEQRAAAYENRPLPIGHGQTISQPFIVALMTDLLEVTPGQRIFELGTGSGYQAAVLAALGAQVFTMEIIPELGERASATLRAQGYRNVTARVGDGYNGWAEHAPFDAIIVTAAGDHVPPPLLAQLKPGGRLVMPVGSRFLTQHLVLVEKAADGTFSSRELLPVVFVPLTGGH